MVFNSGLGNVGSQLGVSTLAQYSPSHTAGPIWDQTPFLEVTANGTPLDHVVSATIVMGLDVVVASATVELTEDPGLGKNTEIAITCGAGAHNARRFRGLYKTTRSIMWPHRFYLICRGMLSRADEYKQSAGASLPTFINQKLPYVGLSLFDIMQGDDATDDNYVVRVLSRVPDLNVDPNDIGGVHHIFGTLAWRELTWSPFVSALAQCQKLDEVSLGYRLTESLDGRIARVQVFGYPTSSADAQFVEGIDIWDATGEKGIEGLANASYVEGYALGGNPGLINAYVAEGNDFQSSDDPIVDPFSSPLIEDADFAMDVANWRLGERNRELVNVQFLTFRDDLLAPGRTITVDIPHAAVQQPVWQQHIEITVGSDPPLFQQLIRGLGGGSAGGSGVGSYPPPNLFV